MFKDILEARIPKAGNPNAKTPQETKEEKKKKDKNKHKGKDMHEGVTILENVLDAKTLKTLETLADLKEEDIKILDNGFSFQFERSLRANRCKVVRYHDKVIIEFRKVTDNILEGKLDKLVFEDVIKEAQFSEVFESVTGIYLSYI